MSFSVFCHKLWLNWMRISKKYELKWNANQFFFLCMLSANFAIFVIFCYFGRMWDYFFYFYFILISNEISCFKFYVFVRFQSNFVFIILIWSNVWNCDKKQAPFFSSDRNCWQRLLHDSRSVGRCNLITHFSFLCWMRTLLLIGISYLFCLKSVYFTYIFVIF